MPHFLTSEKPQAALRLLRGPPNSRASADDHDLGSEGHLRVIVDTIPALVHSALPDGSTDYFNQGWLRFLGAESEEIAGWRWTSKVHPDDIWDLLGRWYACLGPGQPFESESRVRRADGQYRWLLHRTVPLRDRTGRIVRWYGASIDIEDSKRAQEKLREALAEIQLLKDRLLRENIALHEEVDKGSMFEEIVGSSDCLQRVLAQIARVAPTNSTVLLTGETGTGKELAARAIHKRSPRAAGPFVSVNCSAIAQSLIASELFGHEKGAFTGATQRRVGRFELADGGTIFLDEVGELPAETQIALLRVIQERPFERVGGTQTVSVDVRVIAATNRDLKAAISSGTFRQDLFYGLNVFPIDMPPLRGRREDIPLLVRYFADRFGSSMGKRIRTIDRHSLDLLCSYRWPGNIRELQNVIERAVILCDSDSLAIDPSWLDVESEPVPTPLAPMEAALADQERKLIEDALAECHGRVAGASGAATKLGLPRQTLESRIKKLGINKNRFRQQ